MAIIQFEDGTKVEVSGNPSPEDLDHIHQQLLADKSPEPTLASRASGLVQSALTPFSSLATPKGIATAPLNLGSAQLQGAKNVVNTGIAADKNYPVENLLPAAGAGLGAIAGGAATLPSGGAVPLGAVWGAGIGGQAGDTARQYVAALRGNPGVAKDIPEAVTGTAKTGAEMAVAELGTAGVSKALEATGASNIARRGFGKFIDHLSGLMEPSITEPEARALAEKYATAPASDVSKSKDLINGVLEKRGIKINSADTGVKPTEIQAKNFKDAGLTDQEIKGILQPTNETRTPTKMKLSSDLQSSKTSDYKGLASIYEDLNNPKNMTYGKLNQIQNNVGDLANFGAKERTTEEKLAGKIYHELGDSLSQTAKDNGFEEAHKTIKNEGSKFYQKKFLNSALENNRDFTPKGEQTNFGNLASSLNQYTDKQLENIFGENTKYIQTLRDLANNNAKIDKNMVYTRIGRSGPTASVRAGSLFDKLNAGKNTNLILNNRLGAEGSKLSSTVYPRTPFAISQPPIAAAIRQILQQQINTPYENK